MSGGGALAAEVLARTKELAVVPAPPLQEHDRASVVKRWWAAEFEGVVVDEIGNVWAKAQHGSGPAIIIAAHLDTVFGPEVAHFVDERNGRLYGPSVGDDSVAVASLAAIAKLLPPACGHVWLLATVGEEGLGDLAGIRHAITNPVIPMGAVIALEGNWLGRVCNTAVGSIRYRITLRGPGGHAWEASDVDSAVHGAARIVGALDAVPLPDGEKSSINIGIIRGGTAINARASEAHFEIDLRSSSPDGLDELNETLFRVIAANKGDLTEECDCIGSRPAGFIDPDHGLVRAALGALAEAGISTELTAGSTDANAVHAAGIPAVALGVTFGAQEHTTEEWIEVPPISTGLQALADTIKNYARSM